MYLYFIVLIAEFPHVKEFEASQLQHAEAIAAKQVEENGLGIGAPLAGATIQEVNNWITDFKLKYIETAVQGKIPKFKEGITRYLMNKLNGRVDQWILKHNSKTSSYNNFKSELRTTYNETFV